VDDDWAMPIASRRIVAPSELVAALPSFAGALAGGKNAAILLGNFAQQHPQAAALHAAAQALADQTGARLGFLGEAANSVGGYLAGFPANGGLEAALAKDAFLLLNVEPQYDMADPQGAMAAIGRARFTVNLTMFRTDLGDVQLPIAPFTETAGTFVNTEGRVQSFHAAVRPQGEARPAWKVLRVLGAMLGLPGFEYASIEEVRQACLAGRDIGALLSNRIEGAPAAAAAAPAGLQRIADVPIYFADPLVRRAPSLQKTRDARPPQAWMNSRLMRSLGAQEGARLRVRQGEGEAVLSAALDERLPDGCVRIAAGHPATARLGPMFGPVALEVVAMKQVA